MLCLRCNVEMKVGLAIHMFSRPGEFTHFPEIKNAETLKLINCWKCPECGHSDDGK